MGLNAESGRGKLCISCTKKGDSCTNKIGDNWQNDEICPNSKIYKTFDKNLIEKKDKNHYTNIRGRIGIPAQKNFRRKNK